MTIFDPNILKAYKPEVWLWAYTTRPVDQMTDMQPWKDGTWTSARIPLSQRVTVCVAVIHPSYPHGTRVLALDSCCNLQVSKVQLSLRVQKWMKKAARKPRLMAPEVFVLMRLCTCCPYRAFTEQYPMQSMEGSPEKECRRREIKK